MIAQAGAALGEQHGGALRPVDDADQHGGDARRFDQARRQAVEPVVPAGAGAGVERAVGQGKGQRRPGAGLEIGGGHRRGDRLGRRLRPAHSNPSRVSAGAMGKKRFPEATPNWAVPSMPRVSPSATRS